MQLYQLVCLDEKKKKQFAPYVPHMAVNICLSELYDWLDYERGKKGDQNMLQIQTFGIE